MPAEKWIEPDNPLPGPTDVHVRGIDREVWRALRMEAVKRDISVAKLIEELWRASRQTHR